MRRSLRVVIVALLLTTVAAPPADAATGTLLSKNEAMYSRAIRLQHSGLANGRIVVGVTSWVDGVGIGAIFESVNDGASFHQVGTIADHVAAGGLCCTHLFELPRRLGTVPAGTLLWVGTVGPTADGTMSLRIWQSRDHGRHWSYLSTCAQAPAGTALWEPELALDLAGRLVCYFSDETGRPAFSQYIARTVTTDGVNWSDKTPTIASSNARYRPGMANVRRLPNGTFYMTYEICSLPGQFFCAAFFRVSTDGWDWGDPADLGTLLRSREGRYFAHTPTQSWVSGGGPNGRLLVIGQILLNSDGSVAVGNGATLFVNDNNGIGDWAEAPAPVSVPDARDNQCPNYSPVLVPSLDGTKVVEITTDYASDKVCRAYFATGPLPRATG